MKKRKNIKIKKSKKINYSPKFSNKIITKKTNNNANEELDDYIPFYDYDEHCCSVEADAYGVCQYCGAVLPGSMAYLDIFGGE